jgi:hypothetical protein
MGLLDKIFRSNKRGIEEAILNIMPTSELMSEEQFWLIIKASYDSAAGEFDEQQKQLRNLLRNLSLEEIVIFDNRFRQLRGQAYNWQLWGVVYIINGGCNEDCFMDFRDWMIAQGKQFYYTALYNPESLVEVDTDVIDVDWEGIGYVATEVYEALTGQEDFPSDYIEEQKVSGISWNEETDDLKKMYPKLWTKFYIEV